MILDVEQADAVTSEHQNTLVLAGAGSGKTTVLVERVAYLLNSGKVSPFDIIALTFTRKAANEMRKRLQARIGSEAYSIKIGTIHSLALKFIRMYGDKLGLRPSSMTVYGPWEEEFLLKDTAKALKAPAKYREVIEAYYRTGEKPAADSPHRPLFDVFMSRLKKNNSTTYGCLLTGMSEIMPLILNRPVAHVLVDEVQDIDHLQWQIIKAFQDLNPKCSLFVVGDQDQAIYEWRGAKPDYITVLQDWFGIFRLENNYRSTSAIIQNANALIKNNVRRIPKTMRASSAAVDTEAGTVSVIYDVDSLAAAEIIKGLSMLEGQHNVGLGNWIGQIAVLSRNHKLLEKLSGILDEMGMKHHRCGRTAQVMDSEAFRRTHAFFKLLRNRYDNFSFSLIREMLGVGEELYFTIMKRSINEDVSMFEAWSSAFGIDNPFVKFFYEMVDAPLQVICKNLKGLLGDGYDLSSVLSIPLSCYEKGMGLVDYLDWVATYDIQEDVADKDEAPIQLMTIHAAKGLEFKTVIVLGLNEGTLPTKQAITRGDVEEERRLFYVAMTRAERNLFITVRPEEKTYDQKDGKTRSASYPMSRFIRETRM